eukprot:COSAG01_NODE_601_length_14954_cov_175.954359_22_plen_69_part_00
MMPPAVATPAGRDGRGRRGAAASSRMSEDTNRQAQTGRQAEPRVVYFLPSFAPYDRHRIINNKKASSE